MQLSRQCYRNKSRPTLTNTYTAVFRVVSLCYHLFGLQYHFQGHCFNFDLFSRSRGVIELFTTFIHQNIWCHTSTLFFGSQPPGLCHDVNLALCTNFRDKFQRILLGPRLRSSLCPKLGHTLWSLLKPISTHK